MCVKLKLLRCVKLGVLNLNYWGMLQKIEFQLLWCGVQNFIYLLRMMLAMQWFF